jgi:ABC-2 type transport system permease protein
MTSATKTNEVDGSRSEEAGRAPKFNLAGVLSARQRPPRPGPLSTSITFGWRALLKIKHVPMQLFDVTGFPIMFTLMFTYLFGGALAGSTKQYLQYLLPGILVQTVCFITMYTAMAINLDVSKGIFDRFRSLPIWHPSVLVGALLGDTVRYSMASTVVIVLGLVLGFRPEGPWVGIPLAVGLLLLFAFSLSWIWTMMGLIMKAQESVMMVSSMVIFVLTFASNIFVSPVTMPGWLQGFVNQNPISRTATAVRGLMAGTVTTGEILWVLGWSAALVAVFGPITMRLYRRKQ